MEPSTKKKLVIGVGVATVVGGLLWVGTANAKSTRAKAGDAFVANMLATTGYKILPVPSGMPMVDPDPLSKGSKLVEWVRQMQQRGYAVLIPAVYYQGVMNGSPSQLIAVDPSSATLMTQLGIFKIAPRV